MRGSRDKVTPQTVQMVLSRDQMAMTRAGITMVTPTCVAPLIDAKREDCWGRTTLDHIKEEPRAGVRAPSDPFHLVSVCQGHSEDGMKAGYQWNTAHRPELREHIARTTFRCVVCDAAVVDARCGFCGTPVASTGPTQAVSGEGGR